MPEVPFTRVMVEIRHKKSGAVLLRLEYTGLAQSDLAGLNLPGADLRRASLSRANLRGANLTGADLSDADLTEADLQNALLSEADLRGANLDAAQLGGADLTRVIYSRETRWPDGTLPEARGAFFHDPDEEPQDTLDRVPLESRTMSYADGRA